MQHITQNKTQKGFAIKNTWAYKTEESAALKMEKNNCV